MNETNTSVMEFLTKATLEEYGSLQYVSTVQDHSVELMAVTRMGTTQYFLYLDGELKHVYQSFGAIKRKALSIVTDDYEVVEH